MKKAATIAFFVYLITLVAIVYINIINNKVAPKVVCKEVKPLNEQYQDSIEEEVAIPQKTLMMYDALYEASLIK